MCFCIFSLFNFYQEDISKNDIASELHTFTKAAQPKIAAIIEQGVVDEHLLETLLTLNEDIVRSFTCNI